LRLQTIIWVLLKVLTPQLHRAVQHVPGWRIGGRPGLTLRKNKHVPRTSRAKGVPQKSGHMAIYFISQILGSKTHQKSQKCRKNEIKH
jgi:hypothetical protein